MSTINPELFNPANWPLVATPTLGNLYDTLVLAKAELTALQVPNLRSVKSLGAKGDSNGTAGHGTDDTAALNAALATGGLLYVPPGIYRVTAAEALPALVAGVANTAILLDPGATLFVDGDTFNSTGLEIAASGVAVIGRGLIQGAWNDAANGTDAVNGGYSAVKLVRIRPPVEDGAWLTDVRVVGVRFAAAGGIGLMAAHNGTAGFARVTVDACRFDQCYSAILVSGPVQADRAHDVRITRNIVAGTAGPAPTTENAGLGGNAITVQGPVDRIEISGNVVDGCGRMGIEVWAAAVDLQAGHAGHDLLIRGNQVGPCAYRTLSTGAVGCTIEGNGIEGTAQGWDFVELGGDRIVFRGNRVTGSGLVAAWFPDTVAPGWSGDGVVIEGNEIDDGPDAGELGVRVHKYRSVRVANNRLRFRNAVAAGAATRPCIDLFSIGGLVVRENDIVFGSDCDRESVLSLGLCRGGGIVGNTVRLEGAPHAALSILSLGAIEGILIAGNQTMADAGTTIDAPVAGLGVGYTGLWRLMRVSGAWVQTACQGAIANDPPGSPSAGQVYVVGDAPTGAWAGNPRSFAEWDGGSWSFAVILDARLHTETLDLPVTGEPVSLDIDGTAILLAERGMIRCRYTGNNMTAGNSVKGAGGTRGIVAGGAAGLFWQSELVGNADHVRVIRDDGIFALRVELMPAASPPSTLGLYMAPGTIVMSESPAPGGYSGWVRTAADTWKGFGPVEA